MASRYNLDTLVTRESDGPEADIGKPKYIAVTAARKLKESDHGCVLGIGSTAVAVVIPPIPGFRCTIVCVNATADVTFTLDGGGAIHCHEMYTATATNVETNGTTLTADVSKIVAGGHAELVVGSSALAFVHAFGTTAAGWAAA